MEHHPFDFEEWLKRVEAVNEYVTDPAIQDEALFLLAKELPLRDGEVYGISAKRAVHALRKYRERHPVRSL
jgi:hypothetical protein